MSATLGTLAYDARAATTPVYRQANIGRLRLQLGPQHWDAPQITGRWCVQPGDIVLNKLLPIRAAFVPATAKRHPVDGNSLIVRGLRRPDAAWLALCLNQPGYQRLLLIESGVLQRVGLGAVASLRMPPAPPQMDGLSARLGETLDEQALTMEALHHLRAEANESTSAALTMARSTDKGAFYAPDAVTHDSWLPSSTSLRAEQATLEIDLGWVAIRELAVSDDRARLTRSAEGTRALRLRDVSDDLFVSGSDDASHELVPSRTLARPLIPGEVLLSTLGSNFRAAYVDDDVPTDTFPSDGWVRLRFRETPAAWALLLSTDALRSQAVRLAVGSVQQFVPVDALTSLRVPLPSREVRDRWQRSIERHHSLRRAQDREWSALTHELSTVFDAVHQPLAKVGSRAREVLQ